MDKKIVEFNGKSVELSEDENGDLHIKAVPSLPAGEYFACRLAESERGLLYGRKVLVAGVIEGLDDSDSPLFVGTEHTSFWLDANDKVTLLEEESV